MRTRDMCPVIVYMKICVQIEWFLIRSFGQISRFFVEHIIMHDSTSRSIFQNLDDSHSRNNVRNGFFRSLGKRNYRFD